MTLEQFMERVSPEPNTGCWLWTAAMAGNGYPMAWHDGKVRLATRISLMLHGRAPRDAKECAMHRCDTPLCVNPSHLFLGTQLDNIRDMDAKGRRGYAHVYGERQGLSKLTEAQVREIRALSAAGWTQIALGLRYGIDNSTVAQIVHRRTWRHLPSE